MHITVYIIVLVQESVGTVAATPNQPHQNNTEYTFDYPGEATSSFSGNVNPSELVVDDPYELPQLSQNYLAPPLLDETQSDYYVPSMVINFIILIAYMTYHHNSYYIYFIIIH